MSEQAAYIAVGVTNGDGRIVPLCFTRDIQIVDLLFQMVEVLHGVLAIQRCYINTDSVEFVGDCLMEHDEVIDLLDQLAALGE